MTAASTMVPGTPVSADITIDNAHGAMICQEAIKHSPISLIYVYKLA